MIYDDKGNVLVQNRVNPDWPGITFPGGHVEPLESFADAVIREIKEETGLTVTNPKLCGVKDWIIDENSRYIVLLYKSNQFSGELISSNEGEMFWVSADKLKEMPLANDMDELLDVFFSDEYTEQFFEKTENGYKMRII
jgi:8-oxo-dGTP diphosphatase